MRSFALAAVAAIASASQPHEFFAESNLICGLCEQVMDFSAVGQEEAIAQLFDTYPKLESMIWKGLTGSHIQMGDSKGSCARMGLCVEESVMDMLRGEQPLESEKHATIVNAKGSSWKAAVQDRFNGASKRDLRRMMGTVVDPDWIVPSAVKTERTTDSDLPTNFDSRTQWPECAVTINHVRDQSNCGSCWAHGTTEAFNDRTCIASGGETTDLFSVSDTTGCCGALSCASFGCNGGQIGTPWAWFKSTGVVTGGDYGDGTLCYDYTMEKCAHHVTVEGLGSCDDVVQVQPTCNSSCATNTSIDYSTDKHMGTSSYSIIGIENIKEEIYTYGPITGAFTVYEDFETYQSGVYVHETGDALGGHAIKVIGWGTDEDSGLDYWLCVNSWNDTWGDEGTFKISIDDSCGMNRQMHAGQI